MRQFTPQKPGLPAPPPSRHSTQPLRPESRKQCAPENRGRFRFRFRFHSPLHSRFVYPRRAALTIAGIAAPKIRNANGGTMHSIITPMSTPIPAGGAVRRRVAPHRRHAIGQSR
ncbi:hypothetical protein X949_5592 [Burkholderia pseudomallei MSHR5609]|nr:hypothetical protein X949_5592 [Burkholderia pseudomallei MSHR5609]